MPEYPVRGPEVSALGLFVWHDWRAIDKAERELGRDVDIDDYIRRVEVVATGEVRKPTAEDVARIKAYHAQRLLERRGEVA